LLNRQKRGLLFPPHTKNRNKEAFKIKNPKNSIEKVKRKEKNKNHQEKIEINKIFKNYRKQKKQQRLKTQEKETINKTPKILFKNHFK
jgi:hypothetical protein